MNHERRGAWRAEPEACTNPCSMPASCSPFPRVIAGQRVFVLGLGVTGEAVLRHLLEQACDVACWDQRTSPLMEERANLWRKRGVRVVLGELPDASLRADVIVKSPGVPLPAKLLGAGARGAAILSEPELAVRLYPHEKLIGITGTNGKTTSTELTAHLIRAAGQQARVAGNIGVPLIDVLAKAPQETWVVCELSSFQLEDVHLFKPAVAALLNIMEDHLDRHRTFAHYLEQKLKLFGRQGKTDKAVLYLDQPVVASQAEWLAAQVYGFSSRTLPERGAGVEGDELKISDGERLITVARRRELPRQDLGFLENALAASLIAYLAAGEADFASALASYRPLPHRMELVGVAGGVEWVNDSKATNPHAVAAALASCSRPVILLMGGEDKLLPFDRLIPMINAKVKKLILFGAAREAIRRQIGERLPVEAVEVRSLREAVDLAREQAREGDLVLLSPGCASFDEFENYQARGEAFRRWAMSGPGVHGQSGAQDGW